MTNHPDKSNEWSRQLENLLRWEIRRFQIAAVALVVIGISSFVLIGYVVFISPNVDLKWQIVVLGGVTAICFGLPLLQKIDIKKDGGSIETGASIIAEVKKLLAEQHLTEAAARAEVYKQTRQQVGALAAEIQESSEIVKPIESDPRFRESTALESKEPTLREIRRLLPPVSNKEDQQKSRFGSAEQVSGRRIVATTKPSAVDKDWLVATLRVESTDGRPLAGKYVYFFLHETFDPDVYRIAVDKSGAFAEFEISTYGAFTTGAVADKGKTMLEIDLATSKSLEAPKWWRNS